VPQRRRRRPWTSRSKPPVDEKVLAERNAARLKREAADAEKRAAKKAAERAARAEKGDATRAQAAAVPGSPTKADLQAARDARYAARKDRK
jgi:hypothetical protein